MRLPVFYSTSQRTSDSSPCFAPLFPGTIALSIGDYGENRRATSMYRARSGKILCPGEKAEPR